MSASVGSDPSWYPRPQCLFSELMNMLEWKLKRGAIFNVLCICREWGSWLWLALLQRLYASLTILGRVRIEPDTVTELSMYILQGQGRDLSNIRSFCLHCTEGKALTVQGSEAGGLRPCIRPSPLISLLYNLLFLLVLGPVSPKCYVYISLSLITILHLSSHVLISYLDSSDCFVS